GQIVLSGAYAGYTEVGLHLTLSLPGNPTVTIVGVADSATRSADGWVWPGDSAVLAHPTAQQLLYRFRQAATGSELAADLAAVKRALPSGAVTGSTTWLTTRAAANRSLSAFVPFVVVFAVLGLIMSVLITVNV